MGQAVILSVFLAILFCCLMGIAKRYYEAECAGLLIAAKKGNANAQYRLAIAFLEGNGIRKDEAQAFGWFLVAAEQGNVAAQYNVAVMYENGWGVPVNYAQALAWFKKASENGHSDAENKLRFSDRKRSHGNSGRYNDSKTEWFHKETELD